MIKINKNKLFNKEVAGIKLVGIDDKVELVLDRIDNNTWTAVIGKEKKVIQIELITKNENV